MARSTFSQNVISCHVNTQTHKYTYTHANIYARTYAHTTTYTDTHTHTTTQPHTHTHTHTHNHNHNHNHTYTLPLHSPPYVEKGVAAGAERPSCSVVATYLKPYSRATSAYTAPRPDTSTGLLPSRGTSSRMGVWERMTWHVDTEASKWLRGHSHPISHRQHAASERKCVCVCVCVCVCERDRERESV